MARKITRSRVCNHLHSIVTLKYEMISFRVKPDRWMLLAVNISIVLLLSVTTAYAQESHTPAISAGDLVRQTVANELQAANNSSQKYLFRSRKQLPRGSQTRLYVETNDCMAGMTIAIDDQPLNAQQQKAEEDHLGWLAVTPEQLRKKKAREKEDTERTLRILRALPDAFHYEYDGTENGTLGLGKAGEPLARLKFSPNSSYSPPTRVEQVLEGMNGYLLIDPAARRLALIEGTLFRDVTFGWGLIGHLDKGGHFRVQQGDVGDGSWTITAMNLKMTGKILLFKAISIISDEVFSDFQRVPRDLTFAKAVELLKGEQAKLLHASGPEAGKADR
ncbi:MAG TPA: hypothetical protein VJ453_13530 [Terriglobales bacterium]|nr:hypothetical protein [Terriglobales bacterium]